MVIKHNSSLLYIIAMYLIYILFFSFIAKEFNHLSAVDNAEKLPVDLAPWWQQVNYLLYALISLIPIILIHPLIGEVFPKKK
jgi:hypothetical protein